MRIKYLVALLCLIFSIPAIATQDSVKLYNPNIPTVSLPTAHKLYVHRVDLPGPLLLKKVKVRLDGASADGQVKLSIYGHEGGTSFPQLEKTLFGPYTLKKTQSGYQEIEVEIDNEAYFSNNQLFIVLHDWTPGVEILAEASVADAQCTSSSGGNYYAVFAKMSNNQWALINRKAIALDLIVEHEELPTQAWMNDLTEASGLGTELRNKNMVVGDLNGDDLLDLVADKQVFFNEGGFKFIDVSATIGHNQNGVVAHPLIDVNNDGLLDILMLNADSAAHELLLNQGGGQFTVLPLAAQIPVRGISSFSIADINMDGFPDIFVGRLWTMYPAGGPDIVPNHLYLNTGQNDFEDASDLIYGSNWTHRRSRGSAWCDYDNDGDLDLFVANYYLEADELWRNNGDQTFTDVAFLTGIDVNKFNGNSHGTSCDWGDYNNDGNMDLLVPMLAHPNFMKQYDHLPTSLYRNGGAPAFLFYNETGKSNIQYEETHAGGSWGDVDNDGLLDFAISTFYGCRYIDLYHQTADGTFELVTKKFGMEGLVSGEDACWADFDNDGKLDLLMGEAGRLRIFKNEVPVWNHHFMEIELKATTGNKLAIGSRVEVYVNGRRLTQDVNAGRGVRMQRPARVHFGLGTSTKVDSVRVRWYGEQEFKKINGVAVDKINYISEDGSVRLSSREVATDIEFKLYPNPSTGTFTVWTEQEDIFSMFNAQGKLVHSWTQAAFVKQDLNLDLAPGIYYIQGSNAFKRLVIQ